MWSVREGATDGLCGAGDDVCRFGACCSSALNCPSMDCDCAIQLRNEWGCFQVNISSQNHDMCETIQLCRGRIHSPLHLHHMQSVDESITWSWGSSISAIARSVRVSAGAKLRILHPGQRAAGPRVAAMHVEQHHCDQCECGGLHE